MPEVTVDVAGRSYRLGCGEGEEQHLLALAARVDGEAARLGQPVGQLGEGRLMLMSALMLADRLSEAEGALQAAERRAAAAERRAAAAEREAQAQTGQERLDAEQEAEITASLDTIAERIEALTQRLEGSD
jgi:cell division protein ZapA